MKRVYLEITDSCNLDCPFCTYPKGNRFLSYPQIEDCVLQIKEFCDYIYLHMLGEPLLHPDLEKILDLLDDTDMHLQLVTNGTLLSRYPDITSHRCLRKLSISLHSVSGEHACRSYFETIDSLIEEHGKSTLELRFYDPSSLNGDTKAYLESLYERYDVSPGNRKGSLKLKDNVYIYTEDLFRWPSLNDPIIGETGTCRGAVDMIAINSDLKVTVCCLDPLAYNQIGDLRTQTLKQILSSDLYRRGSP